MKTTVDIADPILLRSKALARRRGTTLRRLIEEGLDRLVAESAEQRRPFKLRRIKFSGGGFTPEFNGAGWDAVRDAIYQGRGA